MTVEAPAAGPHAAAKYLPHEARTGVTLCLSGGGFRAALFHLGSLTRLNELGVLARVNRVSCVSGGSIVGAFLASRLRPWPGRDGSEPVVDAERWQRTIVDQIRAFTQKDLRTGPLLRRLWPQNWHRPSASVLGLSDHYAREITGLDLAGLPIDPYFIFCATELVYGVDFIFDREHRGSHQRQYFDDTDAHWSVARAVAASSCFPPVFQPLHVRLAANSPLRRLGRDAGDPAWAENTSHLELSDGGAYDNLGLEPVWQDSDTLLVSDGGAPFRATQDRGFAWRLKRWADVGSHAGGSLRKRWLISNYIAKTLKGAYWGIGSAAATYPGSPGGYSASLVQSAIANIRTDLDVFSDAEAAVLQNHGYSLADAAVYGHMPTLATEHHFAYPFPDWDPGKPELVGDALANSSRRSWPGHESWWKLPGKFVHG